MAAASTSTATSTSVDVASGATSRAPAATPAIVSSDSETESNVEAVTKAEPPPPPSKKKLPYQYNHLYPIHAQARPSTLSHDAPTTPSFIGFRNLMVLVLIMGNMRLVIENFVKYGFLLRLGGASFQNEDVRMGILLYLLVPAHFFVGYLIELVASMHARSARAHNKKYDNKDPKLRAAWALIAFAHAVNASLSLGVSTAVVYYKIGNPAIGTLCEFHAVIVWLKEISYAFTNRDLRDAFLEGAPTPEVYQSCPYPKNITLSNLCYFWWAPTLVYQPVYPRSPRFRWDFFMKRAGEAVGLTIAIWFLTVQYAVPVLQNSLQALVSLNVPIILERLMKLSTISLVIWLFGFFAIFQSFLNGLAELLRFGDREFYIDWWNSPSVGAYWRTWNKPVNSYMRRHVYAPLLQRGWKPSHASIIVFTFSAVLHELLVGVPTHNIIGVAFAGMMFQIPLVALTTPLEKMRGPASVIGNGIFWIAFCLVGQPAAVLLYYFSWQLKFGNAGRGAVTA